MKFLQTIKEEKLYALYHLAIKTGMRQGELPGLRWDDIQGNRIQIRQALARSQDGTVELRQPKTPSSVRNISITESDVKVLQKHRTQQAEERLKVGLAWQPTGLVFMTSLGTPLSHRNVLRQFKALSKRAELPVISFHDLRHTHATMMLEAGVHPKIVQERHGHSKITTTLDTYSHALPNMQEEAARRIENMLDSGPEKYFGTRT